ncbi:hypothetical protein CFC21_069626 [Triticum aestivum]|uniref:GATA-type domain-containing protein n=3 Tax=Triticum TaxID=4564 RepID=A0A9R0WYE1_TRITD|nr:GATA zinc finger domain-containing protein 10-like [Triticum aestivum]KAF7063096.1 hypothetical protein CFC21_069626 [Triticum aestivum]VAI26644.1 unnamed protein product [Triticum turgidum subsp. durum]
MDVHHPPNAAAAAAAAAAALGDMFPQEPAMESEDSSTEWLSIYLGDCLTNPASYPVSEEQASVNPNLPHPSSSNPRRKKRSLASVIRDSDEEYFLIVEPPLLLDQKHWLAESELILPKKDKDQELVQKLEQEHGEAYKPYTVQFKQEQAVMRCSICLSNSNQTPQQWQGGPSGALLCNTCSLRLKAGNGFIKLERCGQQVDEEQDHGRGQDKRKIKKTTYYGDDEEPPQEKRRIKKTSFVDEQGKRRTKKTYVNEEVPLEEPVKRCTHCLSHTTPQWRSGPLGPKTLCNACGVRYKSGRLLPEYRPVNSPTFVSFMHSNSHKKVMQMRKSVENEHEHEYSHSDM